MGVVSLRQALFVAGLAWAASAGADSAPAVRSAGPGIAAAAGIAHPVQIPEGFDAEQAARMRPPAPTALALRMQAVFDAEAKQLAAIRSQLQATRDLKNRIALERQVSVVKAQAQLELFRVELDNSRQVGNAEGIRQLELVVRGLETRVQRAQALAAQPVPVGTSAP